MRKESGKAVEKIHKNFKRSVICCIYPFGYLKLN